jgi:hypothetical protein
MLMAGYLGHACMRNVTMPAFEKIPRFNSAKSMGSRGCQEIVSQSEIR